MYYIMSEYSGKVLDEYSRCPTQEELDKIALSFGDVWVMQGQHTGMESRAYSKEQERRKGEAE